MSHNNQDNPAPSRELTATTNATGVARLGLASGSTPAKKKYGPDLAYTSTPKTFQEARNKLGEEMDGHWLGAMPVGNFFDRFVPATEEPLPDLPDNPFQNVPCDGAESKRYNDFIAAIEGWMPHLHAVNTSNKEDTTNKIKLKTDISIYNRASGMVSPDRTDFSKMELWMEFKAKNDGVAFQDPPNDTERERLLTIEKGSFTPDTAEGKKTRGQLAHYAGAHHSLQFRHFSFSILVHGDFARFLRWDPCGTVVTAAFNYRTDPRPMAQFLWRFDHLSPKQRGHDITIQPADLSPDVDVWAREQLGIANDVPLYRYEVPGLDGMGYAYGPRPPTQNRSLVSRCTRSLPVVWIPTKDVNGDDTSCSDRDTDQHLAQDEVDRGPWSEKRLIYLKDTWRFLSNSPDVEVMAEHEIYEILHRHNTPNIPEHVAGGDIDGGRTQTQEFMDAPWLCVKPRISPYQHYRLVHRVVGRPLFKFECTKQLVTAVFDAVKAHAHAVNSANILHRDISAGNVILTNEGRGLLIDWELAKKIDEDGSRRPDRTGTWQFMSANLLLHRGKLHTLLDDLESFLHVLGWMTLRYVPADDTYPAHQRGIDMYAFDQHYRPHGYSDQGGILKSYILAFGQYPSQFYKPRCKTPLFELLQELRTPFKSLYVACPTDAARKKVEGNFDRSDKKLSRLRRAIDEYDEDMECLQSATWFIDTMKTALNEEGWPTDDKADEALPIALTSKTQLQMQNWTNQLRNTHSLWENSKGVSTSSKRAGSPTPEPSAKRHCGSGI